MKTHSIEPLMNPNVKIRDMKKKFMCTSCHYHKTNDLYFWSVFISIILIFVFIYLCVSFYRFSSILLWSERYTFVHSNRQKKIQNNFFYDRKNSLTRLFWLTSVKILYVPINLPFMMGRCSNLVGFSSFFSLSLTLWAQNYWSVWMKNFLFCFHLVKKSKIEDERKKILALLFCMVGAKVFFKKKNIQIEKNSNGLMLLFVGTYGSLAIEWLVYLCSNFVSLQIYSIFSCVNHWLDIKWIFVVVVHFIVYLSDIFFDKFQFENRRKTTFSFLGGR